MKCLITGCPRSGTRYISDVLITAGKDVPHECRIGEDGIVSWYMFPTITNEAKIHQYRNFKLIKDEGKTHVLRRPCHFDVPVPTVEVKSGLKILHQIREPLSTISSIPKLFPRSHEWACGFIPYKGGDSQLLRFMKMWFHINKMVEKEAVFSYRIENLENVLDEFCKHVCIDKDDFRIAAGKVSKKKNTRHRKTPYTWKQLEYEDKNLTEKIIVLAKKYGYTF